MIESNKGEIISLAQAIEILGVHPNTLRKWDNKGFLKTIRIGTRKDRRYRRSQVIKILKEDFKKEN